jgi:TRAP-type C4-dicarboxylate transport system substrate-binding protein
VRVLEDFRGMKLRAPTRQTNKLLAALGATPVSMPVTALADAMSKGVLDGAMVPWEVVPAVKVQEVARFHTETDPNVPALYTAVFLFAMNPKTYAALPDDLQAVIDRNSGLDLSSQVGRLWDEQTAPARKLATDRGNTVIVVPAAELVRWQRAAQPVAIEWVSDMKRRQIDGDALLADARALLARSAASPPPALRAGK